MSDELLQVKDGRRSTDWRAVVQIPLSIFFYICGPLLEPKAPHKPSMSRILLAIMTYVGWRLFFHEINLHAGQPSIQNAVWTAWWAAEGFLAGAVLIPKAVENYFGVGMAGTVAAAGLPAAIRDKIMEARKRAAALPHDDGDPASEYTD